MSDDTPHPEDDTPEGTAQVLAAEYALGLLEGDEAQQARDRIASEPEFAAMVRLWQERLAALTQGLTPVMPPARARLGILRALGHVHEPLADVPPIRRAGRSSASGGGGFGGWLTWLLGAAVAGAVMLAVIIMPQRGADYAADLVSDPAGLRVEARLDGRDMDIAMAQGGAAEGRDLELWWIAGEGATPVSLGVLPRQGSLTMTLPEGLEPAPGVQLALSDEPLGGSPTGQATGPVVAIAPLTGT